jgi:catechol 2,3-dioxygenase-like lactoylglutathione lyase family enzyme
MKITLSSVIVNDQAKALKFYTEGLGFVVKADTPAGEYRWLTVVSPEGPAGVELLLEPDAHGAAKQYEQALHRDGIPATSFESANIQREYERLCAFGGHVPDAANEDRTCHRRDLRRYVRKPDSASSGIGAIAGWACPESPRRRPRTTGGHSRRHIHLVGDDVLGRGFGETARRNRILGCHALLQGRLQMWRDRRRLIQRQAQPNASAA